MRMSTVCASASAIAWPAGECLERRNTHIHKGAMHCVSDFEQYARKQLDSNAWGYYSSGASTEQTLRDNQEAFQRFPFSRESLCA